MIHISFLFYMTIVLTASFSFIHSSEAYSKASLVRCTLDSPRVRLSNVNNVFSGIMEMDENLHVLKHIRNMLHTLNDLHFESNIDVQKSMNHIISKSKYRKLIHAGSGAEHMIYFNNKASHVSKVERMNLQNFIQKLGKIHHSTSSALEFEMVVSAYANDYESADKNKTLTDLRIVNSIEILKKLAEQNDIHLNIQINKAYSQTTSRKEKNESQSCKIILSRVVDL